MAVGSDPAAKGSAKDLEVAGAGLVHCHFPLPPLLSLPCVVPNVVFLSIMTLCKLIPNLI